jgi:hypothetical protein
MFDIYCNICVICVHLLFGKTHTDKIVYIIWTVYSNLLKNMQYQFSLDGHSAEINMTVLVSSLKMADIMHF